MEYWIICVGKGRVRICNIFRCNVLVFWYGIVISEFIDGFYGFGLFFCKEDCLFINIVGFIREMVY